MATVIPGRFTADVEGEFVPAKGMLVPVSRRGQTAARRIGASKRDEPVEPVLVEPLGAEPVPIDPRRMVPIPPVPATQPGSDPAGGDPL